MFWVVQGLGPGLGVFWAICRFLVGFRVIHRQFAGGLEV